MSKELLSLTVKKEDLLAELGLVRSAAEKKSTIPILHNVLLEAEGDTLTLSATDLELSIQSTCPAKVKRAGSATLPAHKLFDYVRLLPDGEVSLTFEDANWSRMAGGRNKARIAGMARENFPELPEMPESAISLPAKILAGMIGRVQFAVSQEESRFTLNGALLLIGEGLLTLVATDGHRLAFATAPWSEHVGAPAKLLLPKRVLSEAVKLGADLDVDAQLELATDENHVYLSIGPRLLIARRLAGSFPDYARVLPSGDCSTAVVDRSVLLGALARVSEFSDAVSQACRVQFLKGALRIFAMSIETGESEETCECEYAGPEIEIGFNAGYLMQFLNASPGPRVEFRVTDEKSAGELRPALLEGGESYRYVVMPMRV